MRHLQEFESASLLGGCEPTQQARLVPRTIYQLDRHLRPALGRRAIASLTVDDVAELLHELRRTGCSAKTSAGALAAEQLPFIGHLGAASLPATSVLGVLPAVAPTDAEKAEKWDLGVTTPPFKPGIPGVGEVWIDTQFEPVPNQTDDRGVPKPGTIGVVDAATWNVEREVDGLDPQARFRWNNPHNMWADTLLRTVYNGHWFGRWHNKTARATGDVLTTVDVGHAPTHTITNPNEVAAHFEDFTLPLSAEDIFLELEDTAFRGSQKIIDSDPTGVGGNHPHAQWTTSDGEKNVFPNVFKGLGPQGSVSIVREPGHQIVREFRAPAMQGLTRQRGHPVVLYWTFTRRRRLVPARWSASAGTRAR